MRLWRPAALRRSVLFGNVGLGVLALGGTAWGYQTVTGSDRPAATTSGQRTAEVSTGDVTASVSASGTVASASTAAANFVTSGTVTEIAVQVGSVVKKGQVLARVDPTAAKE